MSFNQYESSTQLADPVELYTFTYGQVRVYYCSSDRAYTHQSITYKSANIERSAIDRSLNRERAAINIRVQKTFEVAELFRLFPPMQPVSLEIRKVHRSDPDQESKLIWKGFVSSVKFLGSHADLHCDAMQSALKRNGLKRLYQKHCPFDLYGSNCGVNKNTFKHDLEITQVSNKQISFDLSAFDATYFINGFAEWYDKNNNLSRRLIMAQNMISQYLEFDFGSPDLIAGKTISLYAGCGRNLSDCENKFNNLINYGGQPFIPNRNPFTKSAG